MSPGPTPLLLQDFAQCPALRDGSLLHQRPTKYPIRNFKVSRPAHLETPISPIPLCFFSIVLTSFTYYVIYLLFLSVSPLHTHTKARFFFFFRCSLMCSKCPFCAPAHSSFSINILTINEQIKYLLEMPSSAKCRETIAAGRKRCTGPSRQPLHLHWCPELPPAMLTFNEGEKFLVLDPVPLEVDL